MAQYSDTTWVRRHMIAFLSVIVLVVLVVVAGFRAAIHPFWTWIVLLILFTVLSLVLSRAFTGRTLGILIDDRNKYSLSRLQMLLWTMMILSAFLAAVLANIQLNLLVFVTGAVEPPIILYQPSGRLVSDALWQAGVLEQDPETGLFYAVPSVDLSQLNLAEPLTDGRVIYVPRTGESMPVTEMVAQTEGPQTSSPLSVQIPTEVWLLLGISTTSLVASPLIKGQKDESIVKNQSVQQAKIEDLFKGEESGNVGLVDLGKVQLFYVTLIVIGAYMIAVANLFLSTQTAIASLPALDGGVVAMLGVSHAGYLGNKAVSHNEGAQSADANPAPPPEDQGGVG
ncbi:MAG: hypothetical protein CL610_19910 [Anaerolineaceae bacterium]|nr:hypothetical protein [Anaerolineaceae bacterium]